MVPWVVPGSPTTSCHSFTSRRSARPKELFPTVSHPVSRRLPAHPCANCMPKITREKDADRTLPSCSRTRRLWHIGAMPQSSTLQLYAKLRNVAVVRFSLRNSIQQGLWTCQNFDLWMQELTPVLESAACFVPGSDAGEFPAGRLPVVPKCGLTQSPVAKS